MNKILCLVLFCFCSFATDDFQWQDEGEHHNLKLKKNNNLLPSIKKRFPKAPSQNPMSQSMIDDSFFSGLDNMHDLHHKVKAMQNRMFHQMQEAMTAQSVARTNLMSSTMGFHSNNIKFINKNDYLIVQIPVRSNKVEDFTLSLARNMLHIKQESTSNLSKQNNNSSSRASSYSSSMRSVSLPIIPKKISNQMVAQGKLIVTLQK